MWCTSSPARLLLRCGDQQLSSALLPLSGEEWTLTVSAGSEVNHFSRFSPVKNTHFMAFWWVSSQCPFLACDKKKWVFKFINLFLSFISSTVGIIWRLPTILFTAQEDHVSGHHRKLINILLNFALSQIKWIKCNICQIHRKVFMSNRNTFYILLNTAPSVHE